jgi:hypothetical protein
MEEASLTLWVTGACSVARWLAGLGFDHINVYHMNIKVPHTLVTPVTLVADLIRKLQSLFLNFVSQQSYFQIS